MTAFISASANPDKGLYVSASGTGYIERKSESLEHFNESPAHVPFLKHVAGDVMNPLLISAKGVWSFENSNRTLGTMVEVTFGQSESHF